MYIYLVSSAYTDTHGQKKLGLTIHPVHRMRQYNIGDAPDIGLEKKYDALWVVNATSRNQLKYIEMVIHTHFQAQRNKRQNGSFTEWFNVSLEQVRSFITRQGFFLREVTIDEVKEITEKAEREPLDSEKLEIEEELTLISEEVEKLSLKPIITLKEKFFNTFLPGKVPRRIQDELWDTFETICNDDVLLATIYKGIVQWPTGTGKTIAMLLIIVLVKGRSIRLGKIYRGLLVSPKNDIFNTISSEFNKLSEFGITLYDGSNGRLSGLTVPTNQHILVMACPQSLLIDATGMKNLPYMTHVHYDEVHCITGELYFQLLKEMLVKWDTQFLTGTSATPKTSNPEQHRKLAELFGDPYHVIHRCDVDEAVREGWIATPRFSVCTTPKQEDNGAYVKAFVMGIKKTIQNKKDKKLWKGGKVIAYLPSILTAKNAAEECRKNIPEAEIYIGVGSNSIRTDDDFVNAPADGSIRILFACDRYRAGSDIKGLEMTAVLIYDKISAYILIQILGRSLRLDYPGKEGWCLIVRPCEENESEQEVLDKIALDILTFVGDTRQLVKKDIQDYVETYFGDVELGGNVISKEETVSRIQAAYMRKEYAKRTPKERYHTLRVINNEMELKSKNEYFAKAIEHPNFIEDPKTYFSEWWVSWYDFLGIDCSVFPQTKAEWVRLCKGREMITWDDYKQKRDYTLPENPGELYEDFTNWDKEMGIEEEIVW